MLVGLLGEAEIFLMDCPFVALFFCLVAEMFGPGAASYCMFFSVLDAL